MLLKLRRAKINEKGLEGAAAAKKPFSSSSPVAVAVAVGFGLGVKSFPGSSTMGRSADYRAILFFPAWRDLPSRLPQLVAETFGIARFSNAPTIFRGHSAMKTEAREWKRESIEISLNALLPFAG